MTDPEILDAEPATTGTAGAAGGLLELVLGALTKALPGRMVKVDGSTVTVGGKVDGDVTVQLTPLFVLVGFRGARMAVGGQTPDRLAQDAADKAARFATDALVVFEEMETPGLLRSVVLAVKDGRLHGIVDDGQLPSAAPPHPPRLYSCSGSCSRPPSAEEAKWIARESGGFTGKLKRKLIARVFKRVGASLESAVQGRAAEIRADAGRRTLGPGEE
ncbi:MAG: hypothetical protein HYS27_11280 [Deltaproteobacteria bacterium]|nr:hypothetical protein [Deltaproteobacteria bacterium]